MVRKLIGWPRWVFVSALIVSLCPVVAMADPVAPGPIDRQIARMVGLMLKQYHLSKHPLDKEMSERCIATLLKSLDPMKVYFYQSDIDGFMKHKDEMSDAIRGGDVSFIYTVFRTFLQRVDERVKTVDEILASPIDFNVDEQMVADRDIAQYPKTPAEAADRWRQRIKYDLLVLKASDKDKKEGQEARDKLTRRYHSFAKRMHQTSTSELLEMFLNSYTSAFDPHTDYMSPDSQRDFDIAMSLELEGIGAQLQTEDSYAVVKKIVPGGAADKDGRLKVEDKVVAVGEGDTGEMVEVTDMKIRDVVKLIRGKRGTTVRLEVIPVGSPEHRIYQITREKIELKDSEARGKIFDVNQKADGKPYRIGVIELPSFYRDMAGDRRGSATFKSTTRDVKAILDDFKRQGIDAVVLDLRRNGGGALNEAISLTGLFINDGPVVQVKDSNGRVQPYNDVDPGVTWSGPLVVLISKFSASASEILAGAIQDYNRGLIVGDHATHGKGTVQSLMDLGQQLFRVPNAEPLGALKITMQQFYRPDGDSTQKRGVVSDIELPSLTSHLDVGEGDLDYSLPFDRVAGASFKRFDDVNPTICDQLRQQSEQRVRNSEKFQRELRRIARYKEQKEKKYVSLNEAKFMKERAELNADREEEKVFEEHSELRGGEIKRDYYLDEALAITADYINLQHLAKTPQNGMQSRN